MERIEVDGHLLTWERHGPTAVLGVAPAPRPGAPVRGASSFVLAVRDDRLRVRLALPPTTRTVDVTLQPDLFGQVLPVGTGPCPDGSAGAAVARWAADLGAGSAMWCPPDPAGAGLVATLGGAALPLLGAAYDAGAGPLGEVPRWARPLLAATTPHAAARAAFGVKGTRAVARAVAAGLVIPLPSGPSGMARVGAPTPSGAVALHRVAAALMGEPVLEPDRLARVLVADGPPHPPDRWPDGERVAAGRAMASRLGSVATERVLTEALAADDGPAVLDEVCRLFAGVADQLPARVPGGLVGLRDLCRSLLPLDPDPSAVRWGRLPASPTSRARAPRASAPRTAPRARRPVEPGGVGPAHRPVVPPRAAPRPVLRPDPRARAVVAPEAPPVASNTPLRHPPAVAAVHGTEVGPDLRLVLPRTSDELAAWGRLLRSCIGSFGAAVAAGRSVLIGVEEAGVLAYCLEVTPDGTLRQFLGERNRTVPRPVAATVCDRLVAAGVLCADRTANQVWLLG